jgi:hypothetical protein
VQEENGRLKRLVGRTESASASLTTTVREQAFQKTDPGDVEKNSKVQAEPVCISITLGHT